MGFHSTEELGVADFLPGQLETWGVVWVMVEEEEVMSIETLEQ